MQGTRIKLIYLYEVTNYCRQYNEETF